MRLFFFDAYFCILTLFLINIKILCKQKVSSSVIPPLFTSMIIIALSVAANISIHVPYTGNDSKNKYIFALISYFFVPFTQKFKTSIPF